MVQPRKPGDEQILHQLVDQNRLWGQTHDVLDWVKDSPDRARLALLAAVENQRTPLLKPLLAQADSVTRSEALRMALSKRDDMQPEILYPLVAAAPRGPLPAQVPAAARLLRWAEFPRAAEAAPDFISGLRRRDEYLRKAWRASREAVMATAKEGFAVSSVLNVANAARHGLYAGGSLELVATAVIAGVTAVSLGICAVEDIAREGRIRRLTRPMPSRSGP